jgi:hypothetical protein
MKRVARITANDGEGHKMHVTVAFTSTNGLTTSEVRRVVKDAARAVAAQLQALPYMDFGAENTKVEVR